MGPLVYIPLNSSLPPQQQQRIFDAPPAAPSTGGPTWTESRRIDEHCRNVADNRRNRLCRRPGLLEAESLQSAKTRGELARQPHIDRGQDAQDVRGQESTFGCTLRRTLCQNWRTQPTQPEILRSNLSNTVLELVKLGIKVSFHTFRRIWNLTKKLIWIGSCPIWLCWCPGTWDTYEGTRTIELPCGSRWRREPHCPRCYDGRVPSRSSCR